MPFGRYTVKCNDLQSVYKTSMPGYNAPKCYGALLLSRHYNIKSYACQSVYKNVTRLVFYVIVLY